MLRFDRVRAITFDFYGTLFDDRDPSGDPPLVAALRRLRAGHPTLPPLPQLLERWNARLATTAGAPRPWREIAGRLLREVVPDPAIDLVPCVQQMEEQAARARAFPDALPTLQALQRHFPIAVVSNNVEPDALAAWGEAPAKPLRLVTPQTSGHFKPQPEIFTAACAAVGAPPEAVLHVGDDLHQDVAGALGAGLMAVWLNRDARRAPPNFPPGVPALRSLRGLPPLLTIRPLPKS